MVIVITGERRVGKDTFANFIMDAYPNTEKFAVADWFKRELSVVFDLNKSYFYSDELKDKSFSKPVVFDKEMVVWMSAALTRRDLHKRDSLFFHQLLRPFLGKELKSPREMLEWFGFDVISKLLGDSFHTDQLKKDINTFIKDKPDAIAIITDARRYSQSKWAKENLGAIPVKIERNTGKERGTHAIEKEVSEFPEGWFKQVFQNPYPDLDKYKQETLDFVKESL